MAITKICHTLEMRVFVHEGEVEEAIKAKMLEFLPADLEKEKIILHRTVAEGEKDSIIIIYNVMLTKERHIRFFLEHLLKNLNKEQKELLLRQKESRLDEQLNFFLRLDKSKLLDGEFFITDYGNCYHIRMNLAAYPNRKEEGFKLLEKIFGEG